MQMRGIGYAAVVIHRKCPVTKQMYQDRLAHRVKNADENIRILSGKCFCCHLQQYQDNILILLE